MLELTRKAKAARDELTPRAQILLREYFKGNKSWGEEEAFLMMARDISTMKAEEIETDFAYMRDYNQSMGYFLCPDGRA